MRKNPMNERIKLLAEQAGIYNLELTDETEYWILEKFAELIVKECMEQVWYTREDGINGNVSLVIKQRMKQYFGVEE
jgi:hypothetical protein